MPPRPVPHLRSLSLYQPQLHTACSETASAGNGEPVSSPAGPSVYPPHEHGGSARGNTGQEHGTTSGLSVVGNLPNKSLWAEWGWR